MKVMRNKRFTTLQSLSYTLNHSLEKVYRPRDNSLDAKDSRGFLEKLSDAPLVKKTRPKKVQPIQPEQTPKRCNFRSIRLHTDKYASPSRVKRPSPYNRNRSVDNASAEPAPKQQYPFLTPFEREEVLKYDIYFVGLRRVGSVEEFTASDCEAKVACGDSIAYRYQVLSCLGRGSFGQVFKAYDHKKRQSVALKVIRNEPKFNKQAKVEIKILETVILKDPKFKSNIVQLKHAFFFRGHACLVFELLSINLYEMLRQGRYQGVPLDLIRKITIQILHSLLFLRKQNIVHCDLKPQNVLLKQINKSGIRVIDVGSGCFQSEQIYTYIQSRFYRAPQVILGIKYTPAIDMWSLGCILAELCVGKPLFPGQSQPEQMLMFMEVLGVPPNSLVQQGSRSHKYFDGGMIKVKPNSKGKLRRPNTRTLQGILGSCGDEQFIAFVKRFLCWSPEERMTPSEAMTDKWILRGLPEQVKRQHLSLLSKQ